MNRRRFFSLLAGLAVAVKNPVRAFDAMAQPTIRLVDPPVWRWIAVPTERSAGATMVALSYRYTNEKEEA